MSLTATLTYNGAADAATSAACRSTGDGLTPTAKGSQEMADASDATYIYGNSGATSEWAVGAFTDLPAALGVESVRIEYRHRAGAGKDPGETHRARGVVRIGGTNYYTSYATCGASFTDSAYTWTLNPATSLPWTPAAVNAAQFGGEVDSDAVGAPPSTPELSKVAVYVAYIPRPNQVEVARHLASVDLWLYKRPEAFLNFKGSMDMLNVSMLGLWEVEHIAAPHATASGWEDETWERRPMAVHALDIDPMGMAVTARLKDQRPIRCMLRDVAYSDFASGTLQNGIARFAIPGAVFDPDRASEVTITNPPGETEVLPVDTPAYPSGGLQILPTSGAREKDVIGWDFTETCIIWPAAQWTFQAEVNLAAVSGSLYQTLVFLTYDANNGVAVHYNGASARWECSVEVGGVTYTATYSATPTAGVWYQIGARMTGVQGDNDVSPYTVSVFVDRVKGTDAVASGPMVIPATGTWELKVGHSDVAGAGTAILNGQIRKMHLHQHAFTDVEMGRTI